MNLRSGTTVTLSDPHGRSLVVRVEEICAPEALQSLRALTVEVLAASLEALEIDRVAVVSYSYGAQRLISPLLHERGSETWRDLRGQQLSVFPVL